MKTGLTMDRFLTLDATPMFADVISGALPRPEPFHPSPDDTRWRDRRCWWHYAVNTLAGRKALEYIGCTVNTNEPWVSSTDGWRVQPWIDRGEIANECDNQFGGSVEKLRDAIGDPTAGVFYAEKCRLGYQAVQFVRSNQTMICLNRDGTRAAIAQIGGEGAE